MTHTTTHEKAPGTCDSKGLAAYTTNTDFPTTVQEGKAFARLAARFALASHILSRNNPADSAGMYYAARWGMGTSWTGC